MGRMEKPQIEKASSVGVGIEDLGFGGKSREWREVLVDGDMSVKLFDDRRHGEEWWKGGDETPSGRVVLNSSER